MQLVLNLSMLSERPTGLGVYSGYCAQALAQYFDVGVIAGAAALPEGIPDSRVLERAPASIAVGGGRLAAIRRQLWMRSLRFSAEQLVYSPTHHGPPGVPGQIITVHDLICLRHPMQHKPQYLFFRFGLPLLLKKCRAVMAVSETTRQDIHATYGYPLERIFVVPNGVDSQLFRRADGAAPVPASEPYLLMVGARYAHKNVDEVLRMAPLWSRDFRLIVTSCSPAYKQSLQALLQQHGLQQRVEFRDYVQRDELIALYQGAAALVYPSRWEGFGIPPLESLASGVPVIASDIPVHREVLADAAFFVRLGDGNSWQQAFAGLADPAAVAARMQAAQAVLQRFTWSNSAELLKKSLLDIEPRLAASLRTPATLQTPPTL